mgnify:CR=1 FL=1
MEKRSLEDFTREQIITSNIETKLLRSEAKLSKAFSFLTALTASASVSLFYHADPHPSINSYVLMGLGVFAGGYSIYCFLHGRSLSREASRLEQRILEQKIFEERPERADNAQENYHCRQ